MSARLLRRVLKEQDEQRLSSSLIPDAGGGGGIGGIGGDEVDEESDSPIAGAPSRNLFDLLDDGGSEEDTANVSTEDISEKQQYVVTKSSDVVPAINRRSKKKKKKNKEIQKFAKGKVEESLDSILEELSIDVKASNENICHSAKERNENVIDATKKQVGSSILTADPKHLKAESELRKIFGSRVVNSFENNEIGGNLRQMHGGRRAIHNPRRTILVTPSSYWPRWDGSLSMELIEIKDGLHYFSESGAY
ncbi:uncharacterized protein LOC110029702 isoform X1 [Phalaenopsis equestris]|uniref:uncharacterized protein LOC110029702 isoform X1 n=1 Tax=Phalaenopsis equestris TaxID=78828 RepID=UPI0009E38A8E|nr:uncharacterized protein LOC110029702 isoform X1 [Phalaenopsis equestris]